MQETVKFFQDKYGEKELLVIAIGKAWEKLSSFANRVNANDRSRGRGCGGGRANPRPGGRWTCGCDNDLRTGSRRWCFGIARAIGAHAIEVVLSTALWGRERGGLYWRDEPKRVGLLCHAVVDRARGNARAAGVVPIIGPSDFK